MLNPYYNLCIMYFPDLTTVVGNLSIQAGSSLNSPMLPNKIYFPELQVQNAIYYDFVLCCQSLSTLLVTTFLVSVLFMLGLSSYFTFHLSFFVMSLVIFTECLRNSITINYESAFWSYAGGFRAPLQINGSFNVVANNQFFDMKIYLNSLALFTTAKELSTLAVIGPSIWKSIPAAGMSALVVWEASLMINSSLAPFWEIIRMAPTRWQWNISTLTFENIQKRVDSGRHGCAINSKRKQFVRSSLLLHSMHTR